MECTQGPKGRFSCLTGEAHFFYYTPSTHRDKVAGFLQLSEVRQTREVRYQTLLQKQRGMIIKLFGTRAKGTTQHSHVGRQLGFAIGLWLAICINLPLPVLAHGDIHERIATLTERLMEEPASADLYLERGDLYRQHRNWSAALDDLRRAAQLKPDLTHIQLSRGLTLFEAGELTLAKAALDSFLANHPHHPEALMTRARALARLGDYLAAAGDYTQVIVLRRTPDAYLERAQVLQTAGDSHLEEALRGLNEGLSVLGPLVALEQFAIEIELKRSDYDAALARLDRIAATMDRHESWLTQRGEILTQTGHLVEARQAFAQALAALDILPAHRRNNRAAKALEDRARTGLEQLNTANCC